MSKITTLTTMKSECSTCKNKGVHSKYITTSLCDHLFCSRCTYQYRNIYHFKTCPHCNDDTYDPDDVYYEYKDEDSIDHGCPCKNKACKRDCGTLWCGCIDACRCYSDRD
jgi:hypothetical protein